MLMETESAILPAKERQRGYMEKRPPEVDDFSSPTTVYIRTNIERVKDEDSNEFWEYDEKQLTPEEYADWEKERRISELENIVDSILIEQLSAKGLILNE